MINNRFPPKLKALHNNNIWLLPTMMKERNKTVITVSKSPSKLHNLSLLNKIIKIHYMAYRITHSLLIIDKILQLNWHNKIKMFAITIHKLHKTHKFHKMHRLTKMKINHKTKINNTVDKMIKSKSNKVPTLRNRKYQVQIIEVEPFHQ